MPRQASASQSQTGECDLGDVLAVLTHASPAQHAGGTAVTVEFPPALLASDRPLATALDDILRAAMSACPARVLRRNRQERCSRPLAFPAHPSLLDRMVPTGRSMGVVHPRQVLRRQCRSSMEAAPPDDLVAHQLGQGFSLPPRLSLQPLPLLGQDQPRTRSHRWRGQRRQAF